jgi:hypothetical protein
MDVYVYLAPTGVGYAYTINSAVFFPYIAL